MKTTPEQLIESAKVQKSYYENRWDIRRAEEQAEIIREIQEKLRKYNERMS